MKTKMLLLFAALSLTFCSSAATVTWTSGQIILPNGKVAGAGDVMGYVLYTTDDFVHKVSYYDKIHAGTTKKTGEALVPYNNTYTDVSFFIGQGTSDANGQINVEATGLKTSNDPNNERNNQWAKVYYVCIQDGYEYYKEINGSHYATGPSYMNYENLASQGVWKRGYAVEGWEPPPETIPEPTSGMLMLAGIALVCLRRSSRRDYLC